MAIDPSIILKAARGPDLSSIFKSVLSNVDSLDRLKQNRLLAPIIQQQQQALLANQQLTTEINQQALTESRENQRFNSVLQGANEILPFLQQGDDLGALDALTARRSRLIADGLPTQDTDEAIQMIQTNPRLLQQRTQQVVDRGRQLNLGQASSGTREFNNLLRIAQDPNSTKLEQESARRKLGDLARPTSAAPQIVMIGDVPHIFDRQQNKLVPAKVGGVEVTPESIGDSKAIIAGRKRFAELQGASRSNAIDKGFESIASIDKNTRNLDKAIKALSEGANTGAISKFFPSIRAATRQLNKVQNELALDVIGSVTFGALSQGELDLAKDTALDTGLSEEALLVDLQNRKIAQGKLRAYFNEQIQFLDQGGTIAGFLRSKENQQNVSPQQEVTQPQTIRFDAQGNIIQ